MLGRKNGVAAALQENYPNLIVWHCANHRLEMTDYDTRDEVQGLTHFHLLFDKICRIYGISPKSQSQLRECAAELGEKLKKWEQHFLSDGLLQV